MNTTETNSSQQSESKDINNQSSNGSQKNAKFKAGDEVTFIRVRFPGHNKSYPFLVGKRRLTYGQKVVAMSDRGMAVGYINSFPYVVKYNENMGVLKSIHKIASQEDLDEEAANHRKQKETETICHKLIEKHKLDMNLTHVEFTQYGKKVVFYFTAPARVDFRNLVKDLVSELKMRIELRQISLRDRAASVGSLGPCGRELCCSSFLSKYGNANIKMAKNQNLTINFGKLKGVCGQLKCCLKYEDEVYNHKRKKLPSENTIVETKSGDIGKVKKVHLLSEQFDMITTRGLIRRYSVDQFKKILKDYKFPNSFEHVSFDTSKVIGISEYTQKEDIRVKNETQKIVAKTKKFAYETYSELIHEDYDQHEYKEVKKKEIVIAPILDQDIEKNESLEHQEKSGKSTKRQSRNRQRRNNKNKKKDQSLKD